MNVDVAIIGSGPAGIQAGIHSSRKKATTVIVGRIENSAMHGTHVENHFGASGKADGTELLREGLEKAKQFGCTAVNENIISAARDGDVFKLVTESDTEIVAKAVVIASGVHRNKLGIPGEKEYYGRGVSYCASCDCNFYKGKTVIITGSESEAAASAELMTHYAAKTYWVADAIKASDVMVRKALDSGVMIVKDIVKSVVGADNVTSVTLQNGESIATDGLFIELGGRSSADIAMDLDIIPNAEGIIRVDGGFRTSASGVFACGDITGKPWQVAKAVGEGAVAGINAADHAKEQKDVSQ